MIWRPDSRPYCLNSLWDRLPMSHDLLVIWVWVNTYRYIFSGMNIHLPAILGFTRYQGFDPSPYCQCTLSISAPVWPLLPCWCQEITPEKLLIVARSPGRTKNWPWLASWLSGSDFYYLKILKACFHPKLVAQLPSLSSAAFTLFSLDMVKRKNTIYSRPRPLSSLVKLESNIFLQTEKFGHNSEYIPLRSPL